MPKVLVCSSVCRIVIAVLMLAGMPAARALDINGDGMDDLWQEFYGIAPFDGRSDLDGDGLINLIESLSWSAPRNAASATSFVFFTDVDPADGLDDSWQAKYGIYPQPPSPLNLTQAEKVADPDSDGRTNLEESIAGSDPFTADDPRRPTPPNPGLAPDGPDTFTLSLARTAPGMRYQLQSTEDLVTWTDCWYEIYGDGAPWPFTLDTTGVSRRFYRFVIDRPDDDSDGLINWHEWILGTSPYNSDTDGDGLADGWEAAHGLDPTVKDTDGDGASDGDEVNANSDPKSNQSFPPRWRTESRGCDYTFYNYPATPPGDGTLLIWSPILPSPYLYIPLTVGIPWSSLSTRLALEAPFAPNTTQAGRHDVIQANGSTFSYVNAYVESLPHHLSNIHIGDRFRAQLDELRIFLEMKPAVAEARTRTMLKVTKRTINYGNPVTTVEPVPVTVLAGQTLSDPVDLIPAITTNQTPGTVSTELVEVSLLPMEVAPDLLPVNRGFGEGNINGNDVLDNTVDTISHSLTAKRDTVDGRYKTGDFVTEDLHKGWLGVGPFTLDAAFFDGATVTIRKVIKRDSNGNVLEKGHVRFHATWGDGGETQIIPYRWQNEIDGGDTPPLNLVGPVYGSSSAVPRSAELWMEGYAPGKVTLEFRLQKGTLDFKYEQTFEVSCDWSKAKWQAVVRDHLFSLGKAAQPPVSIDILDYQVANEFLNNRKYVNAVFNYYGTLFLSGNSGNDTKYYWAGLAKTVGAPLYAALSDAQWGRISVIPGVPFPTANTCLQIQGHLMGGNIAVFEDLAWQHRAHATSGVRAMEFLEERGAISNDTFQEWQAIGDISDVKPEVEVQAANQALLEHEQSVILKPAFDQLNAMTVAGMDVSYLLSILTKAPNGTPDFTTVVPAGNICNFNDRWSWITNPGQGMWLAWCQMGRNDRKNVVIFNFMQSAAGFSRLIGVPLVYFLTPSAVFPPP